VSANRICERGVAVCSIHRARRNSCYLIGSETMNKKKSRKTVRRRRHIREKACGIKTVGSAEMNKKITTLLSMKRQDTEQQKNDKTVTAF